MREPGDETGTIKWKRFERNCSEMVRTTEDCVCGDVQGLVAFGEHCTQGQDQNRVNGECVAQMLLQQEPLQDEPGRR